MPKGISPTRRSLKYLRDKGYTVDIVEYWNSFARRRKDAYGFGDLIACGNGQIALIQCTSYSNTNARINKIKSIAAAYEWVWAGGLIIVHGWKKLKRGATLRRVDLTQELKC